MVILELEVLHISGCIFNVPALLPSGGVVSCLQTAHRATEFLFWTLM